MALRYVTHNFMGHTFRFRNTYTIPLLIPEIFKDNYKIFLDGYKFNSGDIVLDIGANEGVWSIMMAKVFPVIQIYAYEAIPKTFDTFMENIQLNSAWNIIAFPFAVSKDIQPVPMVVHKKISGGSSGVQTEFFEDQHYRISVPAITLDSIISDDTIKLLKIDVEGMEYDILYNCSKIKQIENLVGEFHINPTLKQRNFDMESLKEWCSQRVGHVGHIDKTRMSD